MDCDQLIQQTLVSGGRLADQMKPFCKQGLMSEEGRREGEREVYSSSPAVPDDMVMVVVRKRLEQLDCATRGWVLHSFPLTREQAELLTSAGHNANRCGKRMGGRRKKRKWKRLMLDTSLLL